MTNTVKSQSKFSSFLEPRHIAIIGASRDEGKISGRPIEYLKRYGYEGEIYPINPNYDTIQGLKAYNSIEELPDGIDLVIIAISAKYVVDTLKLCADKNVKSCMILSSGFAEMNKEGKNIQEHITAFAQETGMTIIGPNCQGIANLKNKSITTFSTAFVEGELVKGSSAILSQSGAVAAMIYNTQKENGVGIKYWASTGNESDVNIPQIAHDILDDNDIDVVQMYIENIKDGNEIINLGNKSRQLDKPVLVLKPGRSKEAQKAAESHTGALAAEDKIVDKVLENYGLVRVDDVNEMSTFSNIFRLSKRVSGNNVAILSNSGGLGVMMVDKCKEYGLSIARFSEQTIQSLSEVLPDFASYGNPIDVTAQLLNDKELLANTLPILMKDPNVDSILFGLGIIGKGYDIENIMNEIIKAQEMSDKLISVAWVGSQKGGVEKFNKSNVPSFDDPSLCVKAVAKFTEYCLNKGKSVSSINQSKNNVAITNLEEINHVNGFISEYDSKNILKVYLPINDIRIAENRNEIEKIADELEYPVVLKVNSATIQHKSELNGVKLNIKNKKEIISAYTEMSSNKKLLNDDGKLQVIVEKMVDKGFEISLGVKKDPTFGPVIMIASGGIYIEALKDFELLIPPISYEKAEQAVNLLLMSPILKGIRGEKPKDLEELYKVIVNFSEFVIENESIIEEIDVNPIIVHEKGKGVSVVDALIKKNF